MKITVAVMFGSRSVEHEISIISAVQAMAAVTNARYNLLPIYITKQGEMRTGTALFDIKNYKNLADLSQKLTPIIFVKNQVFAIVKGKIAKKPMAKIDVAIPITHGTFGEDGTIQGFLEFNQIPYAGCDIAASAIGMDKVHFKNLLKSADLPVLNGVSFTKREYNLNKDEIAEKIVQTCDFPCIVKPANLGSSVGISKVDDVKSLANSIEQATLLADKILVEPCVTSLREINCAVLGDADEQIVSVLEEPISSDEILSFKDKYQSSSSSKNNAQSAGMASLARKIPAEIDDVKRDEIQDLARKVFCAIGASGVARIDFLVDCNDGEKVYVNEINTIPGSLSFYLFDKIEIDYNTLIEKLIELALKRERVRKSLNFSYDTNILSGKINLGSKGSKG